MSSTFDTVANIIAETCDIPREKIQPESHAIDDLGIDTYSDARCFSYRRSVHRKETDYGRHVHAIALERG